MGQRGPKPLPSKVLEMRGSWRAKGRKAEELQIEPLTELPPPPGFLDDVGAMEWERIGHELIANRLLTSIDLAAFTLYCDCIQEVVACRKYLNQNGNTLETPAGFEQARPEVAILHRARAQARQFFQEFGLTPSARTRVKPPERAPSAPQDDGWGKVAGG